MWAAGAVAAMGSITYPAISSFVSAHAEADQQGRCFTDMKNDLLSSLSCQVLAFWAAVLVRCHHSLYKHIDLKSYFEINIFIESDEVMKSLVHKKRQKIKEF